MQSAEPIVFVNELALELQIEIPIEAVSGTGNVHEKLPPAATWIGGQSNATAPLAGTVAEFIISIHWSLSLDPETDTKVPADAFKTRLASFAVLTTVVAVAGDVVAVIESDPSLLICQK